MWTEAARLGDLNAHYNLGVNYYYGEDVERDVAKGIRHWQHMLQFRAFHNQGTTLDAMNVRMETMKWLSGTGWYLQKWDSRFAE